MNQVDTLGRDRNYKFTAFSYRMDGCGSLYGSFRSFRGLEIKSFRVLEIKRFKD